MKQILEISTAIILSIGGSGAIVLALSSWIGKVWANRILESDKKRYQIEIEEQKVLLSKEILKANHVLSNITFVTNKQYEKEFEIYLEIWESVFELVKDTLNFYPKFENVPSDPKEKEEFDREKYDNYVRSFNIYSKLITKYAPFYNKNFRQNFYDLRQVCYEQADTFRMFQFDVKYSQSFALARDTKMDIEEHRDAYTNRPNRIKELQELLENQIREYLHGLREVR